MTQQTSIHEGRLNSAQNYLTVGGECFEVTALKRRKADEALILRGYNLSDQPTDITIEKAGESPVHLLNL